MQVSPSSTSAGIRDPLRGATLKLDRAGEHIDDFVDRYTAWKKAPPYELATELSTDGTENVAILRMRAAFPDDLHCIMADAIHNLRTTLDQVAFLLATKIAKCIDPDALSSVYFPIAGDAKGLDGTLAERTKVGSCNDAIADFYRLLQPYPGGSGEPIVFLNKLDRFDKHRGIIDLHPADMIRVWRRRPSPWITWIDLAGKSELEVARDSLGIEPEYQADVVYDVSFSEIPGLRRRSIRALGGFRAQAQKVVDQARERFFS
jgi:hypothetical protein